ncbi:ParB N-terminal domain-containing protein [bacterium]|nr:ParB N-terminal domain-containing protein [bacterium]
MKTKQSNDLAVSYVPVSKLKHASYNPRKFSEEQKQQLIKSIERFGLVDPIVVNKAKNRENIIIGGNFRFRVAKELGYKEVPVVHVSISNIEKEKELNLRLNKNTGEFDLELLKGFDESFLEDIGFASAELDSIFDEDNPEVFDLKKELEKVGVKEVEARVDVVETWQHNDTALALIESNGTEYSFEAYLSREHDGALGLHHYGSDYHSLKEGRGQYDAAHDLASLYTGYTSLERPGVPVLPENAELVEVNDRVARFVYRPAAGLEVEAVIDLETKLMTEEIIYVLNKEGNRFEMTTIRYAERSVIPAEEFEEIFDPTQFEYVQIS